MDPDKALLGVVMGEKHFSLPGKLEASEQLFLSNWSMVSYTLIGGVG